MAEAQTHILHLGIAEQGKVHVLAGRYKEALRHFREALRMAASAKAPEIFFRHYSQCVLEALELAGDYDEIIAFCQEADAHYETIPQKHPMLKKDHGELLQRLGIALLLSEQTEAAADVLKRACELAGPGKLPLAETLRDWMTRGYSVPPTMLRQAQRRHRYFIVREDAIERSIARALPPDQGGQAAHAALLG